MSEVKLPVHGFVLAGGKSSRMGEDKALLRFRGKPMVEIAVERLRSFCADVSIAGNREDLSGFAEVVREERLEVGPGAGVEAGLKAARQDWAMFVPVDVPLVPASLLRRWAEEAMERGDAGCGVSFLLVKDERQPTFCFVRRDGVRAVQKALDDGERRVADVLYAVGACDIGWMWAVDAAEFMADSNEHNMEYWFSNVNTPQELAEAEAWAVVQEAGPL